MKTYVTKEDGTKIAVQATYDEESGKPAIAVANKRFATLAELVGAYSEFATERNLNVYCAACTHLHGQGIRFLPIDDVDAFRARYRKLVEQGVTMGRDRPSTANFGPYDVTEISEPRIEGDKLIFYVEEALYGLPYRVEAPWPAREGEKVGFRLLPLKE